MDAMYTVMVKMQLACPGRHLQLDLRETERAVAASTGARHARSVHEQAHSVGIGNCAGCCKSAVECGVAPTPGEPQRSPEHLSAGTRPLSCLPQRPPPRCRSSQVRRVRACESRSVRRSASARRSNILAV
eukprot:355736-Chlamydomonas_euryale.AAC.7